MQARTEGTSRSEKATAQNLQALFMEGETALRSGDLEKAEHAFKQVLAIDPQVSGAYANLGVVYMRRHEWKAALAALQKAEKLSPKIAGIRLNIGLAYYRQGDYWHATPPFESVVKDEPGSLQARHLLGLCYFATQRWVEAVDTLEPLWPQLSNDLNYLYVMAVAANKAERHELDQRAVARMVEVGGDTPTFHLLMGKAKLNDEAYDDAVQELTSAAKQDPKLPFVHYYLAMAYAKKGLYDQAAQEFQKDIVLEPDVIFNYNELGNAYFEAGKYPEAEKAYREALRLNSKLLSAHLGLVKVYQREGEYEKALGELEIAGKLDPGSAQIHYLRGQTLIKLGRKEEGKRELDQSVAMSNARREKRQQELGEEPPSAVPVPDPQ
jgi:tetratricopeptide (TPR) repeat protein